MTHSEEKKQGRWNVIRVSQVSAAIPYLAPQCSSLHSTAMETINYPPLTNFHHHFYGQRCSRKELPSWNCTAGAAGMCVQKEAAWKRAVTGEMAKEWDEQVGKCSMVRHDGKNPLLLPISSNSWNQGGPGHLKSMERFFLGLMFGQGALGWFQGSDSELTQVKEAVPSLLVPQRTWCHFHTNMMEKRIISPPVQLQSVITWITV